MWTMPSMSAGVLTPVFVLTCGMLSLPCGAINSGFLAMTSSEEKSATFLVADSYDCDDQYPPPPRKGEHGNGQPPPHGQDGAPRSPQQLRHAANAKLANATCNGVTDPTVCQARHAPDGWECKWNGRRCLAVDKCAWPEKNVMYHPKVTESLPLMWIFGTFNFFRCIENGLDGCTIPWGHCLWAAVLASCCCCCCCYPCIMYADEIKSCCCPNATVSSLTAVLTEWRPPPAAGPEDDVICDRNPGDDWRLLGNVVCERRLRQMLVKVEWKDGGSGPQEARIRVRLMRPVGSTQQQSEREICSADIFGVCSRETDRLGRNAYASADRTFECADQLISSANAQDTLRFEYLVGSGEGQLMRIRYFEAIPEYEGS